MLKYLLIFSLCLIPFTSYAKKGLTGHWHVKNHGIEIVISPPSGKMIYMVLTIVKANATMPFIGKVSYKDGKHEFFVESPPHKTSDTCVEVFRVVSSGVLKGNNYDTKAMLIHAKQCKNKELEMQFSLLNGVWKRKSSEIQISN